MATRRGFRKRRAAFGALAISLGSLGVMLAQRPFREYPAMEYANFPLPDDYRDPAEFVFARLMYPSGGRYGGFGRFGRDWREGYTTWTNDYPRSDRHLLLAVRRLTRVHARSVEQPVNLEDGDDVYNWPFLYTGMAGRWSLTDAQTAKLRDYLDRGGFLIGDDIWGTIEWAGFLESIERVIPSRTFTEMEDSNPAFHTVFDLDHRYQISGAWSIGGRPYLNDGIDPHWRAAYDDKGRLLVGAWVNNDTGDSWEWADDPRYPERYSALGIRIAVNHIVYALTH